jgi:CBS domain-containing protein
MNAADVMVTNVITVTPETSVQEAAQALLDNRISGAPVVDGKGAVVGILSEGDLIRRAESGTRRHRSSWLEFLTGKEVLAAEFVKEHSRKVADVMTSDVITASPTTSLLEIADTLEKNGIKRVPIVDHGKLVGIVSRANLLQALASVGRTITVGTTPTDQAIRQNLLMRLRSEAWSRPSLLNILVRDGVVELWGTVDSASEKNAVRVAAEVTPGVRSVVDNISIQRIETGI